MRTATSALLAAICTAVLVGCGGSGSTVLGIDSNPRIRVVDAFNNPGTSTIRVDSQTIKDAAAFQYVSDYNVFENGNHQIQFLDGTTAAALVDTSELLELNHFYTAVAYRNSGTTWSLMFISDKPENSLTDAQIRVLNATTVPVDVYITAPGADISTATPTVANETGGDTTPGYNLASLGGSASGTFQIRVTTPGTKDVISVTNVTMNSHEAKTVILTAGSGVQALLPLPTVKY